MVFVKTYGFSILDMILLFIFFDGILTSKMKGKCRFLILIFLLLQFPVSYFLGISNVKIADSLIAIIMSFLVSILFYSGTFFLRIIYPIIYWMLLLVCETIPIFVMVIIMNKDWNTIMTDDVIYIGCGCASVVLMFMIILIIILKKRIVESKLAEKRYKIEIFMVFSIVIIYMVFAANALSNIEWLQSNISLVVVISCVFASLTSLAIILVYNIISRQSQYNMELAAKLQMIENENKLNADMVNIVKRLRSLRHDMNNHVGVMKCLLEAKQYDELENYLQNIYSDVKMVNDFVVVNNNVLGYLLNTKKGKAGQEHVDLEVVISSEEIPMSDNDMVSLLSNILDNAIEAASKMEWDKYVMLNIKRMTDKVIIECENTFIENPVIVDKEFVSSKKEKEEHGIGLKNVHDIVEKYNGKLTIDITDIFVLRVEIPINNRDKGQEK